MGGSLFVRRPEPSSNKPPKLSSTADLALPGVSTSVFLIALISTKTAPPDTSPRFLQRYFERFISVEQRDVVIREWLSWYDKASPNPNYWTVTDPMLAVLEQAEAIAHQVTGLRSEIQLRHLIGALLTIPETGALIFSAN